VSEGLSAKSKRKLRERIRDVRLLKRKGKPEKKPMVLSAGRYSPEELQRILNRAGVEDSEPASVVKPPSLRPAATSPTVTAQEPSTPLPTPTTQLSVAVPQAAASSVVAGVAHPKTFMERIRERREGELATRALKELERPFPTRFRRTGFKWCTCIITKKMYDMRFIIGQRRVRTDSQTFRVKHHTFIVDPSKAFMVGRKGPYLMFDVDYAEPLEKQPGGVRMNFDPLMLGDEIHPSAIVDLQQHGNIFQKALSALGEAGQFSIITWVMVLMAGLMGFFGGTFYFQATHTCGVATSTTTTTSHMIVEMLRRVR
jgi:hypothetical protein